VGFFGTLYSSPPIRFVRDGKVVDGPRKRCSPADRTVVRGTSGQVHRFGRQSILQALAEQGRLVRLPQNKIGTYNKANKAYMAFEQEHEREPSTEELAELLEMSETEINNIFQSNTRHSSLDAPVHEAEDVAMGDLLEGGDETDDDVMKDSLRAEIRRVLKSLSPREAEIVNAYFGLDGENGVTIEQIGQKYDLTKERIRQIKERAIKRLQKARYSNALKAYLG
jgi:RNA polymerase primary sigma factor